MKAVTTARLAAACLLIVPAASACDRSQPRTDATNTPPAVTEPGAQSRDDHSISTEVQAKYYSDDTIRGRQVDVSAQSGVVTLRGTVPTEEAKQQAVSLARSVPGVTSVNDELNVQAAEVPTAASRETGSQATGTTGRGAEAMEPAWITTKIQSQYFLDSNIKPWNIDVTSASGGVVTLEGTVDNAQTKAEAVRIARETEGVTRVEDRLKVEGNATDAQGEATDTGDTDAAAANASAATPPDGWLTAKIQAKYFVDDEVKGRAIDVDTQSGVVTLKGTVANESERRQAVAIAQNTDGVRSVTDQLRVDASATRSGERTSPVSLPAVPQIDRPDSWITMKIQSKYFLDADVKGHRIDVDTANGVVTLKGSVATAENKRQAEQIARDTEGVKRVVNQLSVG